MKKTIAAIGFVLVGAGTYAFASSISSTSVGDKNCQARENVDIVNTAQKIEAQAVPVKIVFLITENNGLF